MERWKENPYWQYFCCEVNFQHHWPFDLELIKFRLRMGEKGMERILKISIDLFEKKKANAAARKIKVIVGSIVRDLERKLNTEQLGRY